MSATPQSIPHDPEIERIRDEYRRRALEIPKSFYEWSRPVNLYFQCQLTRDIIALLDQTGRFPLKGKSIADIGCGTGAWLLEFAQWGAASAGLSGIDLDEARVRVAQAALPAADLHVGSAATLPWPNQSQDLVSQFTLFSSILSPELKRTIAVEMLRVLKPDGAVLWYDLAYDNPRNRNVKGIGLSEMRELFPGCSITTRKVTLAPPLARATVPRSWILASMLERLPFLRTHHLHLICEPKV